MNLNQLLLLLLKEVNIIESIKVNYDGKDYQTEKIALMFRKDKIIYCSTISSTIF